MRAVETKYQFKLYCHQFRMLIVVIRITTKKKLKNTQKGNKVGIEMIH